jgi:hypothetical protein
LKSKGLGKISEPGQKYEIMWYRWHYITKDMKFSTDKLSPRHQEKKK